MKNSSIALFPHTPDTRHLDYMKTRANILHEHMCTIEQ